MKNTTIRCSCKRVSNPITLSIVNDAWIKSSYGYFQFNCPQCNKTHIIKTLWDEKLNKD